MGPRCATTSVAGFATEAIGASFPMARRMTGSATGTMTATVTVIATAIATATEIVTVTATVITTVTAIVITIVAVIGIEGQVMTKGDLTVKSATRGGKSASSGRGRRSSCCTSTRWRCRGGPRWTPHRRTARSTWTLCPMRNSSTVALMPSVRPRRSSASRAPAAAATSASGSTARPRAASRPASGSGPSPSGRCPRSAPGGRWTARSARTRTASSPGLSALEESRFAS
mmetsp:Transcript_45679/g.115175  ORF Transcript_45679/g.115175 Transcript_45679/m.115175 type:complete len:229 (-) Transcript_45679:1045-1731(-)